MNISPKVLRARLAAEEVAAARAAAQAVVPLAPPFEPVVASMPVEPEPVEEGAEVDPLRCTVCGKRMSSSFALKGHMRKHE